MTDLILNLVIKPYTIINKDQINMKYQEHKHQTQKWPRWNFNCEIDFLATMDFNKQAIDFRLDYD